MPYPKAAINMMPNIAWIAGKRLALGTLTKSRVVGLRRRAAAVDFVTSARSNPPMKVSWPGRPSAPNSSAAQTLCTTATVRQPVQPNTM